MLAPYASLQLAWHRSVHASVCSTLELLFNFLVFGTQYGTQLRRRVSNDTDLIPAVCIPIEAVAGCKRVHWQPLTTAKRLRGRRIPLASVVDGAWTSYAGQLAMLGWRPKRVKRAFLRHS